MNNLICIIGNDNRMNYVAEHLYNMGYELSREESDIGEASYVVLPPVYKAELLVRDNTTVFAGSIVPESIKDNPNIKYVNYAVMEEFVRYNALLTAKGLLQEMKEDFDISAKKIAVSGYGYCGKEIANILKNEGEFTVLVRRKNLKEEILNAGCGYINIEDIKSKEIPDYDFIVNTVPAMLFDERILSKIDKSVKIYDIASMPGGVDFDYCKINDIFVHHSLGIPGKRYPKEAGLIIAQIVSNYINSISSL